MNFQTAITKRKSKVKQEVIIMNLKKLYELRATKVEEMKKLVDGANTETRALNEEEVNAFSALEKEVKDIDATIAAVEATRSLENVDAPADDAEAETRFC